MSKWREVVSSPLVGRRGAGEVIRKVWEAVTFPTFLPVSLRDAPLRYTDRISPHL
jgi:hypothetical protein